MLRRRQLCFSHVESIIVVHPNTVAHTLETIALRQETKIIFIQRGYVLHKVGDRRRPWWMSMVWMMIIDNQMTFI